MGGVARKGASMKPAAMKREAVENELLSRDSIHIAKANETEAENPSPLKPAHSPFGGSAAARVLACQASVGLIEKVPAYLCKVSAYAERGTALHTAMALLI